MARPNSNVLYDDVRLYFLVRDVAGDVLNSMLEYFIPPRKIEGVLQKNNIKSIINRLKSKNVLQQYQYDLLFPNTGSVDVKRFNITLNFCLLRTLCTRHDCVDPPKVPLSVPETGWNDEPDVADRSPQASLVRIKLSRNHLFHLGSEPLSKDQFEERYNYLTNALEDLAGYLGCKSRICKRIEEVAKYKYQVMLVEDKYAVAGWTRNMQ